MSEEYNPLLTQTPLFDFNDAIENYGFDWATFSIDNFEDFIIKTFITDFIKFRISYIKRDYHEGVKRLAHKFKGSFSY